MTDNRKLMTTVEAANELCVSYRTVARWCDSGELKHIKKFGDRGRRLWRFVTPADLAACIRRNTFARSKFYNSVARARMAKIREGVNTTQELSLIHI